MLSTITELAGQRDRELANQIMGQHLAFAAVHTEDAVDHLQEAIAALLGPDDPGLAYLLDPNAQPDPDIFQNIQLGGMPIAVQRTQGEPNGEEA